MPYRRLCNEKRRLVWYEIRVWPAYSFDSDRSSTRQECLIRLGDGEERERERCMRCDVCERGRATVAYTISIKHAALNVCRVDNNNNFVFVVMSRKKLHAHHPCTLLDGLCPNGRVSTLACPIVLRPVCWPNVVVPPRRLPIHTHVRQGGGEDEGQHMQGVMHVESNTRSTGST